MPRFGIGRWFLFLAALLMLGGPAAADRFHVRVGGERMSGPSDPDDWMPANCYADLAAAMAVATAADSVLLFSERHTVAAPIAVTAGFVGNRELSSDSRGALLELGDAGQLTVGAAGDSLRLQGMTLYGGSDQRTLPALETSLGILDLALDGCDFVGFHALNVDLTGGAALRLQHGGELHVSDCLFLDNVGAGFGGAVRLPSGLTATFERCVWRGNQTRGGPDPRGGAVFIDARFLLSTVTFLNCEFRDNASGGPGGAVSALSACVLLEDCLVIGSRSGLDNGWSEGAGVHFRRNAGDHTESTPATARRCTFIDNKGEPDVIFDGGDGGAFYTAGATGGRTTEALVEDCLFRENYNLQGSSVYVSRFSEGLVRRSRFFDNIAYFHAGGVYKGGNSYANLGETLEVDSCLFVRNRAGFDADGVPANNYCRGGAIVCRMIPRMIVRHCTFVENTIYDSSYRFGDAFAHFFESGFWEPEMLCVLQNCVFWGTDEVDVQAWSSDGGMALVENNASEAGQIYTGGAPHPGAVILTANPFTNPESGFPLADGPLIDAGIDLGFTEDIDGRTMPVGPGPDIGCFEWYDVVPVLDLPAADPVLTAGPNPFNPRTVLACRLAAPAVLRLALHDARGRLVRELWSGPVAAGEHRWTWDGRDTQGRECASGVYVARLVLDGRAADTHKITLVR